MLGARPTLADTAAHQARERWEYIDGRGHTAAVQLAAQHDLPFGDVAREVGNGMRDIVVGHRENRNLRNRSRFALNDSRALIQRREVGVHIAGIAAPPRNLLACGGNLSECFAIVRHVGDHHEHMQAAFVCEMLGGGEREPRRMKPLHRRMRRLVQIEHRARQCTACADTIQKVARLTRRDTHGGKHHGEWFVTRGACPFHNARGNLEPWQPWPAEDRKLLAAHEGVHGINRTDAGFNKVAWPCAPHGVDGCTVNGTKRFANRCRESVNGRTVTVKGAAEQFAPHDRGGDLAGQNDFRAIRCEADGIIEELYDRRVLASINHLSAAVSDSGLPHHDPFAERHRAGALQKEQGATGGGGAVMRDVEARTHGVTPSRCAASARRVGARSSSAKAVPEARARSPSRNASRAACASA